MSDQLPTPQPDNITPPNQTSAETLKETLTEAVNQPTEATKAAVKPVEAQLEATLAAINTPEKAEALVAQLEANAAGQMEGEEGDKVGQVAGASQETQAAAAATAVEAAVAQAPNQPVAEAAAAIETIAREAVALDGPAYEALVEAVQTVTDPALKGEPEKLAQPRRLLRDAIMDQMSFFQKYDTALFLAINNAPHTPNTNRFFEQLSFWFNGGWGWIIGAALFWPFRRQQSTDLLKRISLPIWVAAGVVEGPIKKYFRRRRPFIDVVRAVVVGKKPGNWSFPSGHSAAGFAGAWLLHRCLPRWAPLWYAIAALVGFSRVYLGAHYPGDVASGSVIGIALAEGTRRLMRRYGLVWGERRD